MQFETPFDEDNLREQNCLLVCLILELAIQASGLLDCKIGSV